MGGFVSGTLGIGSSPAAQGSRWEGGLAPLVTPATEQQANTAYGQTQDALAQQQSFLKALQAQNGIQNQSDVYNQLSGVANGQGPNPAAAMLSQATGANVANQAALMAGQRGASVNPALIARLAAQQGGNIQQQAAGQGAVLQANQSLNALNAMGNISGQQVGNQAAATQVYNQAAQGQQSNILNALGNQNNANVANYSQLNNVNQKQASQGMTQQDSFIKGIGGAAAAFAEGGEVKKPVAQYAEGGAIAGSAPKNPMSSFLYGWSSTQGPGAAPMPTSLQEAAGDSRVSGSEYAGMSLGKGVKSLFSSSPAPTGSAGGTSLGSMPSATMSKGGKVPALVSPGEVYLPPNKAKEVAEKGKNPISEGQRIPGKAKVKGDSLKNDIVPRSLDVGGVVIPRSVMESKDPAKEAANFVRAVLAKHSMKAKK